MFISVACPICSYNCATLIYDGGLLPLATLGWPISKEEAQTMPRFPHHFVQCLSCSHIWNSQFQYDVIPYQNKPNRMFNNGNNWKGFLLETKKSLLQLLPESPVIIDIGCGEGHFIRDLSLLYNGTGRFLGFDPNGNLKETGRNIEFYAKLFEPLTDINIYNPDLIIIRHVFEHMTNPVQFIEQLAFAVSQKNKPCFLFAEVPCVDRALSTNRTSDFFYEHVSQFTTDSFKCLMMKGGKIEKLAHGYHQEVVYAIVSLGITLQQNLMIDKSRCINKTINDNLEIIRRQVDNIFRDNKHIAIWGGTGKGAAFINQYHMDANRFPLVVDSDFDKVNTYVPGTGQCIQFRDVLKKMEMDIIIIPSQWRARDIIKEISTENISVKTILIEHCGKLINFETDVHPY